MSDIGCVGSIIEDTIDVLRMMYENKELSEEKLRFAMILLNSIYVNCKEQKIDLELMEYYILYMNKWTS